MERAKLREEAGEGAMDEEAADEVTAEILPRWVGRCAWMEGLLSCVLSCLMLCVAWHSVQSVAVLHAPTNQPANQLP